jgi:hypothetical protein
MGVLGLAFLLWVLARAFGVARRLWQTADDPFVRALALAVAAGLAGQVAAALVGDYLLPAYHNGGHTNLSATIYTWMLLGMLMAAERLTAERLNAAHAADQG